MSTKTGGEPARYVAAKQIVVIVRGVVVVEWVEIGDARLACGNCLEILPTLGKVDAVITDPPYGIAGIWKGGAGGKSSWKMPASGTHQWDQKRPSGAVWAMMNATNRIIWGGNYFADQLPPTRGWLLWDKKAPMSWRTTGHAELAWTDLDQPIKAFRLALCEAHDEMRPKEHETQKPASLMSWCLGFLPDANTILDPFMGSGTTGVACAKLGRKFIGIELEKRYFDIACERIEKAYAQPDLFIEQEKQRAVQEELL